MSIYKPALDALQNSPLSGPILAALVEALREKIEDTGAPQVYAEVRLGYIPPDTPEELLPQAGEYLPEVIVKLTKI
jgi:hypothetical protein